MAAVCCGAVTAPQTLLVWIGAESACKHQKLKVGGGGDVCTFTCCVLFFFLYLPPSLLNDFLYSSLFPGLGGVLLPLLRQPLDPGVSDRGLLAGGRRHAEGVHQQSRPLRCLQELTGLLFLFFLYMYMNFQLLHPSQCVDT